MERMQQINEENKHAILRQTKNEVFELLKKSLRPEFLNRIDELILFEPLSRKHVRKIVDIQFRQIQKRLDAAGIVLEAAPEVMDHLGNLGYEPQFGARPLKRVLQQYILNELSKEILKGNVNKDSVVGITLGDNKEIKFFNVDNVSLEE